MSVIQMARSVGVALLAMLAAIALALASTLSSAIQLLASTALIMSGTFTPTPPPAFVDMAKNHFILPTHPGQIIGPFLAVTTPEEAWPVTGLFDLPFGDSVAIGLDDLQAAMALHGNAPRPRVSGPDGTSASSDDRASAGSASAGDSTDGPAKP